MKDRDYGYVGVAKIKSTFLTEFKSKLNELIISNDLQLWWENVLYELSEKYMIEVKDIRGMFWGEVDTEKDYARILKYIENEE
jgi:choline kinase